jgi:hypothetical protein
MEKATLYNDLHPQTSLKNTGFKDVKTANNTIKIISKRSLKYQFDVINTMYNRAKYHPHQTTDMKKAMKIFSSWLDKYNKKKELENKKYPWLPFDIVKKYEKIAKSYNITKSKEIYENFLYIYKKFNNKIHKLQYIPCKINNYIFDFWSYRIIIIKSILKQMKQNNTPLYYKTGIYKDLPTKEHIILILHGFSPDQKNI